MIHTFKTATRANEKIFPDPQEMPNSAWIWPFLRGQKFFFLARVAGLNVWIIKYDSYNLAKLFSRQSGSFTSAGNSWHEVAQVLSLVLGVQPLFQELPALVKEPDCLENSLARL